MPVPRLCRFRGSFAVFSTANGVQGETGYSDGIVQELWRKYDHFMPTAPQGVDKAEAYFYAALKFIHLCPHPTKTGSLLYTPHTGFISSSTFDRQIAPRLIILGTVINEIDWALRHDEFNHVPHFKYFCVGALDTFPVRISEPSNSRVARLYYQPKYGCCVVKCQLIVDFNGNIIFCSIPHLGTTGDARIWRHCRPVFSLNEYVLADGAYRSSAHTLVPYREDRAGGIGVGEEKVNDIIQYYRARVEHIIGVIQNHEFFRTKARMSMDLITACTKISVHATALHLRKRHQFAYRYPHTVVGPHPHNAPDLLGW